MEIMRKNLERKLKQLIKNELMALITEDMTVTVDMDYEKLINKPTVNGTPLVGDLSKYLDNLKLDQLEQILREEGM